MNQIITLNRSALTLALIGVITNVSAFNAGDVIGFEPGVTECLFDQGVPPNNCSYGTKVTSGSYFGLDTNGNGVVSEAERVAIEMGPDGGIIIGALQAAIPGDDFGCPDNSISSIDMPWCFAGYTGMHQTTTIPVTDNGDGTMDFSGWSVLWFGGTVPVPGTAILTCTKLPCLPSDAYSIHMDTAVSSGGFQGFGYQLHLEKTGPIAPVVNLVINIDGGSIQECSATGGSSIFINALATPPDGDQVNTVSWMIDGVFAGNGAAINPFITLGGHEISATVTTVNGLTNMSFKTVTVNDTQAPQVSAAFLNARTQQVVTTAVSRGKVEIQAEAADVCDASPVVEAMVGANVGDGDRLSVSRRSGNMSLNIDQLDLSVRGTDASNNSAAANSVLVITQ